MAFTYPPVGFHFSVALDAGILLDSLFSGPDASFQEVSGMRVQFGSEDVAEGGVNQFVHRLPKPPTYSNLTLKRGVVVLPSPLAFWVSGTLGSLPVMVSLHATKVFGVGEGGLILCRDSELLRRCGRALNFGFDGSRDALTTGFNGKMSEYHAAVGLAALDGWPQTRAAFLAVGEAYRQAARGAA